MGGDNLTGIFDKRDEKYISEIVMVLIAFRPDIYKDDKSIAKAYETLKKARRHLTEIEGEKTIEKQEECGGICNG